MLNFVIFWEGRVVFSLYQNCQKQPILSLSERLMYFFASSIVSKMLNFFHFLRGQCIFSHFQFCQKWSILSFWKVDFKLWDKYKYTMCTLCVVIQTILSKMLHFVSLWGARVFFRFFNFVKNAQFCHFLRGPCGISLFQNCQKCPILSLSERLVYFFASSILSNMLNFVNF